MAGGFVGKLGATVGQRWRNKRTIRSYVIPKNPQTPAQRANRGKFAQAIHAAQEAIIFNKGAPCWDKIDVTEWQQRVSTAKQRIDSGVTGDNILPFYPDGYSPYITVTYAYYVFAHTAGQAGTVTIYVPQWTAQEVGRAMFIQLKITTEAGQPENIYREITDIVAGTTNTVQLTVPPEVQAINTIEIMGVSTDDATHDGKMVYIAGLVPVEYKPAELTVQNYISCVNEICRVNVNSGIIEGDTPNTKLHGRFYNSDSGEYEELNIAQYEYIPSPRPGRPARIGFSIPIKYVFTEGNVWALKTAGTSEKGYSYFSEPLTAQATFTRQQNIDGDKIGIGNVTGDILEFTFAIHARPTNAPITISVVVARGKTSRESLTSENIEILSGGTFTTDGQVITARAVMDGEATITEDWEVDVTASSYGEKYSVEMW
jgi:hypothetical protein